jgi:hypothetical protein
MATFNDVQLTSKSIRNMYFVKDDKEPKETVDQEAKEVSFLKMKPIKFSFKDKMAEYPIPSCFVGKTKTEMREIFETGQDRMKRDMDIFHITHTLYKLKACIAVLIGKSNDPHILDTVKNAFRKQVILDYEEEEQAKDPLFSKFIEFMNVEVKTLIYQGDNSQTTLLDASMFKNNQTPSTPIDETSKSPLIIDNNFIADNKENKAVKMDEQMIEI